MDWSWRAGSHPLPGLDLLGAAAVNAQMVVEIARVYGISLSRKSAQDLALSVGRTMAGLGLVKGEWGCWPRPSASMCPPWW